MKQSPAVVSTATQPGSLLSQYKLLRAVIDAPWATRLDHKVISHVIERYFGKHGNARASLRYLEVATGAERNKIIPSLRRLIDNDAISIIRQGIGTRPTEYGLNFDFANKINVIAKNKKPFAKNNKPDGHSASGPPDDTSRESSGSSDGTSNEDSSGALEGTSTSGAREGTSCGAREGTSSGSSGAREGTQTYLRTELTSSRTVSRNDTHATAAPPPVSGLEADPAGVARDPEKVADPFDELWNGYALKLDIKKAKAAYKALKPSAELHADLVTQAVAWATHYEQANTEKRYRKRLHNWLAGECYLEDLPVLYEDAKEVAIARAQQNGPRKGKPQAEKEIGLSPKTPIGRHKVTITASELIRSGVFDSEQRFKFAFRIEDGKHEGKEFSHAFNIISADERLQTEGQAILGQITRATGIAPEDTSDLHGLPLLAINHGMGRVEYAAV